MIPKIMRYYINDKTENIIKNYINDDSYFVTKNKFLLNMLKIGPFNKERNLDVKFSSLIFKKIIFKQAKYEVEKTQDGSYFYIIYFNSDILINYDLSMEVRHKEIKFYLWINLWYSTLEIISRYIYRNKLFLKEHKVDEYHLNKIIADKRTSFTPSFVEMKNLFLDFNNLEDVNYERFDRKDFCIKQTRHLSLEFKLDETSENLISETQKVKIFEDSSDNLIELINSLRKDSDLNKLIEGVNKISSERNLELFDKSDLIVELCATDLDKFKKAKEMMGGFKVELHYKITN